MEGESELDASATESALSTDNGVSNEDIVTMETQQTDISDREPDIRATETHPDSEDSSDIISKIKAEEDSKKEEMVTDLETVDDARDNQEILAPPEKDIGEEVKPETDSVKRRSSQDSADTDKDITKPCTEIESSKMETDELIGQESLVGESDQFIDVT